MKANSLSRGTRPSQNYESNYTALQGGGSEEEEEEHFFNRCQDHFMRHSNSCRVSPHRTAARR